MIDRSIKDSCLKPHSFVTFVAQSKPRNERGVVWWPSVDTNNACEGNWGVWRHFCSIRCHNWHGTVTRIDFLGYIPRRFYNHSKKSFIAKIVLTIKRRGTFYRTSPSPQSLEILTIKPRRQGLLELRISILQWSRDVVDSPSTCPSRAKVVISRFAGQIGESYYF